jgi:hypothetical protein
VTESAEAASVGGLFILQALKTIPLAARRRAVQAWGLFVHLKTEPAAQGVQNQEVLGLAENPLSLRGRIFVNFSSAYWKAS